MNFKEVIAKHCEKKNSKMVLSVSPDWEKLPDSLKKQYKSIGAALFVYNKGILDALHDRITAVLLDVSAFEAYGISGIVSLKSTIDYAKSLGVLVIAATEKAVRPERIKANFKGFVAPIPQGLPEDSPLREGGFDADAMTVCLPIDEKASLLLAGELERYGAGLLISARETEFDGAVAAAQKVGAEQCGVLLNGSCLAIAEAAKKAPNVICVGLPSGFTGQEELSLAGQSCTLTATPPELLYSYRAGDKNGDDFVAAAKEAFLRFQTILKEKQGI